METMQGCLLCVLLLGGMSIANGNLPTDGGGKEGRQLAAGKTCVNTCMTNVTKLCNCKRSNGTVCENCCNAKKGCYLENAGGDILCKGNYSGGKCPLFCVSGLHRLCGCKEDKNPKCVNCCTLSPGCSLYNKTSGAFICSKGFGVCTKC